MAGVLAAVAVVGAVSGIIKGIGGWKKKKAAKAKEKAAAAALAKATAGLEAVDTSNPFKDAKNAYEGLENKKFDDMLLNESNDLSRWKLNSVIGYKKNRLISYPSNYFHSKYPNKGWKKGRKVFVMFYK